MNITDQEENLARQQIDNFVERFGAFKGDANGYRHLVYHAALPFVLTPELLKYLRIQFLAGEISWVAEVDFLLSDLCQPVGYELYVIKTDIRAYALKQLKQEFGLSRMEAVARRLINYIRYLTKNTAINKQELKAQQWAAMVYLEDERENAVKEIAEEFYQCVSPAQQKRLARIVQGLAPQIQSHPELLIYAQEVSKVLRTHTTTTAVSTISLKSLQQFNLQTFPVDVATIIFEEELSKSNFETIYINKQGKIIRTEECEAYYYEEPLEIIPPTPLKKGDKSKIQNLTMIAIPKGEYWMGSPEEEKDRYDDESPQHPVKVPAFFMSQTPITEAQWKFVANLPQEQKALETDPSNNGDDHPVVNISWQDAIEFCARLSRHTGRNYRLPSEAKWEYACRALPLDSESIQNTPPFHFGETITSELANYDGSVIYQEEPKGANRGKTTPVRSFKPNAFGLYDMHGNVWEWCLDPWHENYQGAPSDSRVWDKEDNDNRYQNILDSINVLIKDDRSHVLRGGSWFVDPRICRSAARNGSGLRYGSFGFRVVCAPQDL